MPDYKNLTLCCRKHTNCNNIPPNSSKDLCYTHCRKIQHQRRKRSYNHVPECNILYFWLP